MAENEVVTENKVPIHLKVWAAVKEWCRKQIVVLKRAPQRIPLAFTAIVTFIWLIWLYTFSYAVSLTDAVTGTGILLFVVTLFSVLVIPLFLSAFPKRSKPKILFIALLFVFFAIIIVCDAMYYVQEGNFLSDPAKSSEDFLAKNPCLNKSLNLAIAHIVLVGLCMILLATLPLYKKLILKINTKKVIAENKLSEEIDTSEEV